MYKSLNRNEDFYCLVQCGCGRKFKAEEMYICYVCKKIKCKYCTRVEGQLFQCKAGCQNQFTAGTKTKNIKFCCTKCLECPLCFSPLIIKSFKGKYYLSCSSCYWDSIKIHITKAKKEELESYIERMNEETINGFLKKMYNVTLSQLENNPLVANKPKKQIEFDERINEDSYNDLVKKAMEEGEQKLENFEEKIKTELAQEEKNAQGKCEYEDNYLNNEDYKYYGLKIMNKLLPCAIDFNKNFN